MNKDWWLKFFRDLDTNHNGDLSLTEFEVGLLRIKYPDASISQVSRTRRRALLKLLDTDGNGALDL